MPVATVTAAHGLTLAEAWRRSARRFSDRVAVAAGDRRLTYAELDGRSDRLAAALTGRGIVRGDRVAALSVNVPEYVELYLAAAKLGVCVAALNTRLHRDELAQCVAQCRPRLLFASAGLAATAAQLVAPQDAVVFGERYESLLADAVDRVRSAAPAAEDIHNILFTSGTTGRAKAAMISQRAAVARAERLIGHYRLDSADGFIGWTPLFHCGGDEPLYATLLSGGVYAPIEKAEPVAMYAAIARERLTWTLLLPGVITDFIDHPARADHDLSSLRFAIGYANMMPEVVRRFGELTGAGFWDAFGQTETSFLLAHGWVAPGADPSFRKWPTPLMDVRIVNAELREQPVGVPGECVVRGPSVMSGYLDDDEATAEAFRGGWLHTGDVLVRNDDGSLSFVDRSKYLIKTGGENVYPAEVEQVIALHPAVQEACVIGVPDEHWGETIKAVVVLRPGAALDPGEVVAWCRERLAGYKRPRYVQFLTAEELPRSTTGKLLRHEIAARGVQASELVAEETGF
jgi:acyl-CoA synthetase (AMP-forming)/AMP-acid ligase II